MIAVVQPQLIVASLIFWSLRNMNLSIKLQHPVSLLKANLICYLKIVVLFLLCSGYMHSEICKTHKFAFAWAVPLNFNTFFLIGIDGNAKFKHVSLENFLFLFFHFRPVFDLFYNCKSDGIGNLASICFNGTFYVQIVFIIDRKFSVKQLDPVRNGSTALHFESVCF